MEFVRGWRRAVIVVVSTLISIALPSEAAATPSAQLVYVRGVGTERCPDAAALRKAVAARVGFDPFFPYASQTLVAEIAAAKKGFRGRVQVLDDAGHVRGERVIESEGSDCTEMLGVMALGISIALDYLDSKKSEAAPAPSAAPPPDASDAAAAPALAPLPRDARPLPPPERQPEPAPPTPPASTRATYDIRAGAAGSVGTAPAVAFGGTVALGARWRALGVLLEGRFHPRVSSPAAGGGSVWSSLTVGTAAFCLNGAVPYACVIGSVGSFRGGGDDIISPQSGSAFYGAVGARVGAQLTVFQSLYAYGQLDVSYTLTPAKVVIDNREAFALSALTGAVGLGLGVRF